MVSILQLPGSVKPMVSILQLPGSVKPMVPILQLPGGVKPMVPILQFPGPGWPLLCNYNMNHVKSSINKLYIPPECVSSTKLGIAKKIVQKL
jgi:hypothetical protein